MRVLAYASVIFFVLAVTIWLGGVAWIVLNAIFPLWIAVAVAAAITGLILVVDVTIVGIRHLTKKRAKPEEWGDPQPAEAPDESIIREQVNDLWHSWRNRTE